MPASLQTFPTPTVATSQLIGLTAASSATITGGTITTAGVVVAISNPAGAITGVIMAPGTVDGQIVVVINAAAAANTITMAAAATSNVANGVATVLTGLRAHVFVWSAATSLWYSLFT